MKVPVYDAPQVAPGINPDVRVNLQNVGAGGEAIGQGLKQLGAGIDQLGGGLEELQRRTAAKADRLAAMNAQTQYDKDRNAVLYGDLTQTPTPNTSAGTAADPLLSAGGGTVASHAAGDLAYADDKDTHEQPTGPSHAAASAVADPTSGLATGGYLNAKGMVPQKHAHATMDFLEGRIEAIGKGLPSDRARDLFREQALRSLEDTRGQVERHAHQQAEVAQQSALQANVAASFGEVQKSADFFAAGDGASAAKDALQVMAPIEANMRAFATTPEAGESQVMNYRQEQMDGLVKRYVDAKDWKSAKDVLEGQADALRYGKDGEGRVAAWQRTITLGQQKTDGENTAQALVSGAVDPVSGLVDRNKAIASFEGLSEDKRVEAESAFNKHLELRDKQSTAIVANSVTKALGQALVNHSISDVDASTQAYLKKYAPEKWDALEEKQHRWDVEAKAAAKGPKAAKPTGPTPEDLSLGVAQAELAQDPNKFVKMSDPEFQMRFGLDLSGPGYRELAKARAEAIKAANLPDKDTSTPPPAHAAVLKIGGSGGVKLWDEKIPSAKWNDEQKTEFAEGIKETNEFRATYKHGHRGAEPTQEDYEKALGPVFRSKVTIVNGDKGWLWDTDLTVPTPLYRGSDEYSGMTAVPTEAYAQPGETTAANVPEDAAKEIRRQASGRGATLTDQQVADLYRKHQDAKPRATRKKMVLPAVDASPERPDAEVLSGFQRDASAADDVIKL